MACAKYARLLELFAKVSNLHMFFWDLDFEKQLFVASRKSAGIESESGK